MVGLLELRTNRARRVGSVAYVRTVKTGSGATAVQAVWSSRRVSRDIEHVSSAHDDEELEALKAAAIQRLAAGQGRVSGLPQDTQSSSSRTAHVSSREGPRIAVDNLCPRWLQQIRRHSNTGCIPNLLIRTA